MAIAISSPITGSAQTGLTSPTYTVTADTAPNNSTSKLVAVTALGGTQTGVTTHSGSSPFSLMVQRPSKWNMLGTPNPATGVVANVPTNTFRVVTKKGVTPAVNQSIRVATIDSSIVIPAGSDTYDAANIRAAISAHIGLLQQISAGLGDTVITGVM